jgi:hypothetical protein
MLSDALRRALVSIAAGLAAGTSNLVAAGLTFGGTLTHGLQSIASGLLGDREFSGGTAIAVLGLGLYCANLIVAAAVYAEAAVRNRMLGERWLVSGTMFGVIAYAVMNLAVAPLPYAANPDFSLVVVKELLAHTIMFGIPIASVLRVDAPGAATPRLATLPYRKIKRPKWQFDN